MIVRKKVLKVPQSDLESYISVLSTIFKKEIDKITKLNTNSQRSFYQYLHDTDYD